MARVPALFAVLLLTEALILLPVPTATAAHGTDDADRYLVTFTGTPDDGTLQSLEARGLRVLEEFTFIHGLLVEAPATVIRDLRTAPHVASVVPDEPLTPLMERARAAAHADLPPRLAEDGGQNVTIAFVDSGFDAQHPGFDGRVRVHLTFDRGGARSGGPDRDGHGTHVAGILAGDGDESRNQRHHGIAPQAGIAALDISPSFTTSNAVRAFQWVYDHHDAHDIRVISNSWGREKEGARYDPDDPLIRASNALVSEGIVVVFSAGNRGEAGASSLTIEAMNPNVLTVGSASPRGTPERYSSRGPALDTRDEPLPWTKPDVVAVGTHVQSARTSLRAPSDATGEARYYVVMNGTSMAAPQAAGAAALLVSRDPSLSPLVVHALLTRTADDLGARGPDNVTGYGMLNVEAALQALEHAERGPRVVKVVEYDRVAAEGAATGAGEALVLHGADSPDAGDRITVPLRMKDNAERALLWFNWTGPGTFTVHLEGPDGKVGPFQPAREGVIPIDASVDEGRWVLVATPHGAATRADWTLEGAIARVETHVVGGGTLPSGRPIWGEAGFIIPAGEWLNPESLAGPGLALAGLAAFGGYTVYRGRKPKA